MGFFSSDKKVTTNTTAFNTSIGQENIEGHAVAIAGDGNTVALTDHDAIASAFEVGTEALRIGRDQLDIAAQFAGRGLDTALDATRSSLAFAERQGDSAIGAVREIAERSLDRGLEAQAELTGRNIEGLTALARQTSTSADERVTQVAGYALLAVAAAVVLPALLKRFAA